MLSAFRALVLGSCLLVLGGPTCNGQQRKAGDYTATTLAGLASSPEQYIDQRVTVEGELFNEGKNYFRDLRLALKDSEGHKVYVRPWLPVSLPPMPPGAKRSRAEDTVELPWENKWN